MKSIKQVLLLWFALGAVYLVMEGVWRGGWTHISMLAVGGLCGVLIGAVNQIPRFYHLRIVWQSLIGTAIVLVVELLSGCIINLWWGWGVWDYTGRFGNVLGQICIPYALLWVLLMPFAIWFEDTLRYHLWTYFTRCGQPYELPEYEPYRLRDIYRDLFTGR